MSAAAAAAAAAASGQTHLQFPSALPRLSLLPWRALRSSSSPLSHVTCAQIFVGIPVYEAIQRRFGGGTVPELAFDAAAPAPSTHLHESTAAAAPGPSYRRFRLHYPAGTRHWVLRPEPSREAVPTDSLAHGAIILAAPCATAPEFLQLAGGGYVKRQVGRCLSEGLGGSLVCWRSAPPQACPDLLWVSCALPRQVHLGTAAPPDPPLSCSSFSCCSSCTTPRPQDEGFLRKYGREALSFGWVEEEAQRGQAPLPRAPDAVPDARAACAACGLARTQAAAADRHLKHCSRCQAIWYCCAVCQVGAGAGAAPPDVA